ncbi:MAG: tRNA lysidine(34) synthetase TilS [Taibaiella sp.]|nr:tRNA lysidine(34) synthetase TilS [Taibaiella sp.]
MSLLKRFQENWRRSGFGANNATVLLAVSGGADSMTMAHLFLESAISIAVAHCNFQLRGDEADKDEELVRDWCGKNNIAFHHVRFDTKAKTEEWKKGIQETARILRYDWLEKTRKESGYAFIATAHHANDNAETLLMNLFKGTGISGLHGIPQRNGNIVRPLLFASKKDIAEYIIQHNVAYREDASNALDKYTRNDVRLNILPAIEKSFPNIISSLNNSMQRFSEAEELYKRAIEQERKKLVERRGKDYYIAVRKLEKRQPLHTLCYELFKPFGFTPGQVQDIISLLSSESGHYLISPTHRVIRDRDFLIITLFDTREADFISIEKIPVTLKAGGRQYKFKYAPVPETLPAADDTACIDTAKLEQPLILRRWKQGDYFYPLGMGMKKKKLSRYFIDKKTPLHEKENIWVLESNKRIVWIAGHRLDERFKVGTSTKEVLIARIT